MGILTLYLGNVQCFSLFFLKMVNNSTVLYLTLGFSYKGVMYPGWGKLCPSQEFVF